MQGLGNIHTLPKLDNLIIEHNNLLGGGAFPSEILEMGQLRILEAKDCNFGGPLPSDIGVKMSSLQRISLWENNLTGTIPVLPTQLTYCDLRKLNFGFSKTATDLLQLILN